MAQCHCAIDRSSFWRTRLLPDKVQDMGDKSLTLALLLLVMMMMMMMMMIASICSTFLIVMMKMMMTASIMIL